MKRLYIIFSLITLIGLCGHAAQINFKSRSLLADGKWIKIGVEQTGVYEITYETLKAMGFSNPEKVAVYGRGGKMMSHDFVTNAGIPTFTDDLEAVSVYRRNNTLYFYAQGTEDIGFTSNANYDTQGYFTRKSLNIYTTRGYYFLTDSEPSKEMSVNGYDSSASTKVVSGLSYLYHEKDLMQTRSSTGQLFWGERLGLPYDPEVSWNVSMPDALESKGVMECKIYLSNEDRAVDAATVSYGFKNTDEIASFPYKISGSTYYVPFASGLSQISVPGPTGTVFARFDYNYMLDDAFLDYWVVTYKRSIPTMKDSDGKRLNQQFMAIPEIAYNTSGYFTLQDAADYVVLDVSTPEEPKVLAVDSRTGNVSVRNAKRNNFPQIVVFDSSLPQLQISGFEKAFNPVANQNLHAWSQKGADFIIISTPEFREYAEQIADLHRTYDGIEVAVATTEECYNEFSQGVPDPMAYRLFARMLYSSPVKPKNIMLMGPLYADFRGLTVERDPLDGIIAFQSPYVSIERGAHNINDYYGCMSDQYNVDYFERNVIDMGVGIMPLKFAREAEIVVKKIEDYLKRDDFAYYLNKYTAVGGLGDTHTHDGQVASIHSHIRDLDFDGTVFTPLAIDSYGNVEAHKKFVNQLNDGCLLMTYFGHGAEQFLGKDRNFFTAGDVFTLRNKTPFFAGFAGCQITNTDRGLRGLGETIVTATPYGAIGAIVSARETWSGQNMEFFKQFLNSFHNVGAGKNDPHRYEAATIGQIYAKMKTFSSYSNELAYQLLCDPALVIPNINRSVSIDFSTLAGGAMAGETLTVKGHVNIGAETDADTKFNGKVVVRLMEPERMLKGGCLETGETENLPVFTYRDAQLSMGNGEIKNGKFEVSLHVPGSASGFKNQKGILYVSVYNPETRTGGASGFDISFLTPSGASAESRDNIAPVIEHLGFNQTDATLGFTVSDNLALNLSTNAMDQGLYLYIDGKEFPGAYYGVASYESNRPAYSKSVILDWLTYGDHTARLKVKDAAGNIAEQEITFSYNPEQALYLISRAEESDRDKTIIEFMDKTPSQATLHILNARGDEIWSGPVTNGKAQWNHVDRNNKPVAPGHYKAYIIEKGNSTSKGHSETIDIPVI